MELLPIKEGILEYKLIKFLNRDMTYFKLQNINDVLCQKIHKY